jgi:hypothetical protein
MELLERVENRQKYMPETIEASITELQYRKYEFSEEELKVVNEDIQALRANAALVGNAKGLFSREYKNVIVQDPDAPRLYSRMVVKLFTVLFGALFGSIMMAMNLNNFGKSKEAVWALLFGVGFTTVQYVVLSHVPGSVSSIQVVFGFIGAYLIDFLFWKPYIGYATFYRKRPTWVPLIIALVFVSLIIASIIYAVK